ncbi:MAG TPA: VCBS repeat-containing protein [Terracidiphilus sp.]|nr:VCBS repeat-containing protein [Terracidiphilus sp.]
MRTSCIVIAAIAVCAAVPAQTPVFSQRTYTGMYSYNHAELNNDGHEDLLYHTPTGFAVVLSTGPGTYAAPVDYNVPDNKPSGTISLDVNNDTRMDVIAFNSSAPGFYEYLNTGNGVLKLQATYEMPNIQDMVVGDFNHDGYPDIAFTTSDNNLHVWFNNHARGFTVGPTTSVPGILQLSVGDFDGDGKADIAATSGTGTYLYFSDGAGHFSVVNATTAHHPYMYLMDIDGDGKSDLVGAAVAGESAPGGPDTFYRDLFVVYGNSSRTIAESEIPLNGYAVAWQDGYVFGEATPSGDVADFNGDGKRDFAVVETQDNDGFGTRTLAVLTGNGNRTWNPEVNVYSDSHLDFGVAAIRVENSLKPALLVDTFLNNSNTAHFFINDTSGGYFGGCEFPSGGWGMVFCSPPSYSSSPQPWKVSGVVQTTMRKMELWVDGVKKYQEIGNHDFGHYGVLDTTLTLSKGTHQVTVVAAGYDNLEVKVTQTESVP